MIQIGNFGTMRTGISYQKNTYLFIWNSEEKMPERKLTLEIHLRETDTLMDKLKDMFEKRLATDYPEAEIVYHTITDQETNSPTFIGKKNDMQLFKFSYLVAPSDITKAFKTTL